MKNELILAAGLCFALISCNHSPEDNIAQETADSTVAYSGSSAAAVVNDNDTVHTFIRTADLKFRVSNVEKTTYEVEDIIVRHKGFVTLTNLSSQKEKETTTVISNDSLLETTLFTVTNTITARVPNTKLDTILKDIAGLVDYLDYRIIKADDVSQQFHSNNLQRKRTGEYRSRLTAAIDKRGRKLAEMSDAEEQLLRKQEAADATELSNRLLQDEVNFSTVQLSLYQRQAIKRELVPNNENLTAYEPHFGTKVLYALQSGLQKVESIFIGILYLWPFILIVFSGFILYKKYGYKPKK